MHNRQNINSFTNELVDKDKLDKHIIRKLSQNTNTGGIHGEGNGGRPYDIKPPETPLQLINLKQLGLDRFTSPT